MEFHFFLTARAYRKFMKIHDFNEFQLILIEFCSWLERFRVFQKNTHNWKRWYRLQTQK